MTKAQAKKAEAELQEAIRHARHIVAHGLAWDEDGEQTLWSDARDVSLLVDEEVVLSLAVAVVNLQARVESLEAERDGAVESSPDYIDRYVAGDRR